MGAAGVRAAGTMAETAVAPDGSFTLHAPPGSYHVVARAADGAPLASTHETPFAVEPDKSVHLVLDAKRPPPLTQGAPASRRAALFADMTFAQRDGGAGGERIADADKAAGHIRKVCARRGRKRRRTGEGRRR